MAQDWARVAKIGEEMGEAIQELTLLTGQVAASYQAQPMAQDWARVAKIGEEMGEAIQELSLLTGQNPRKPIDSNAYDRLLMELADTAMTGVYAIQHFTKDIEQTQAIMAAAQEKHYKRLCDA